MGWSKSTISRLNRVQLKAITKKTGWKPQTPGGIYGYWTKVGEVKPPKCIAITPKQLINLVRGFFVYENQCLADQLVASMTYQGKRYYRDSSSRLWLLFELDGEHMFQTQEVDQSLLKEVGRHCKALETTEAWNTPIHPADIWDDTQDNPTDKQGSTNPPINTVCTIEELASLLSCSVDDLRVVDMWEAVDGNIDWLKVNGCQWIPNDQHLTHWTLRG